MKYEGISIGFAITGSFSTFEKIIPEVEKMVAEGGYPGYPLRKSGGLGQKA